MNIFGVIAFMVGSSAVVFGIAIAIVKTAEIRERLYAGEVSAKLLHAHRVAVGTAKSVEIEQGVL